MLLLVLGLVLFLGVHSVRILAGGWRDRTRARLGANAYRGVYSLVSLAGLVLIVYGFAQARADSPVLWVSPFGLKMFAVLLVAVAFVLVTAAYVPGNQIKAAVHHPMLLGVKTWAAAHLLANGRLVDVVLFGAFLAWSVVDFATCRRRDRAAGTTYPPGRSGATVKTVVIGLVVFALFGQFVHPWLFGVRPFP